MSNRPMWLLRERLQQRLAEQEKHLVPGIAPPRTSGVIEGIKLAIWELDQVDASTPAETVWTRPICRFCYDEGTAAEHNHFEGR